jgi:predicted RNA-binding protein YlqC (UPF0109 family)
VSDVTPHHGTQAQEPAGPPPGARFAELTRFIVERMVGSPESVSVRSIPRGRSTIVEVEVAEADKGKLIGKSGRNIDAVRAVVRAAGLRAHQRVQVELAGRR